MDIVAGGHVVVPELVRDVVFDVVQIVEASVASADLIATQVAHALMESRPHPAWETWKCTGAEDFTSRAAQLRLQCSSAHSGICSRLTELRRGEFWVSDRKSVLQDAESLWLK
jgi:hypothetical protein